MKDPIATLYACDKLIEKQRFAGLDQNPKGVRDLLYCAIRAAEAEIDRLRENLRRADALADQAAKAIPLEFALSPSDGGGVDTHHAVEDMAAELERLRADNARLREALAPFGRVAERDIGERAHDKDRFVPLTPKNVRSRVLYVRDFRRAREAMEASK